jgi:hypothetical protein
VAVPVEAAGVVGISGVVEIGAGAVRAAGTDPVATATAEVTAVGCVTPVVVDAAPPDVVVDDATAAWSSDGASLVGLVADPSGTLPAVTRPRPSARSPPSARVPASGLGLLSRRAAGRFSGDRPSSRRAARSGTASWCDRASRRLCSNDGGLAPAALAPPRRVPDEPVASGPVAGATLALAIIAILLTSA